MSSQYQQVMLFSIIDIKHIALDDTHMTLNETLPFTDFII